MAHRICVSAEEFQRDETGHDRVLGKPDCGVASEAEFVHDAVARVVDGAADVGGEVAAGLVGFEVFDEVAGVLVDAIVPGRGRRRGRRGAWWRGARWRGAWWRGAWWRGHSCHTERGEAEVVAEESCACGKHDEGR